MKRVIFMSDGTRLWVNWIEWEEQKMSLSHFLSLSLAHLFSLSLSCWENGTQIIDREREREMRRERVDFIIRFFFNAVELNVLSRHFGHRTKKVLKRERNSEKVRKERWERKRNRQEREREGREARERVCYKLFQYFHSPRISIQEWHNNLNYFLELSFSSFLTLSFLSLSLFLTISLSLSLSLSFSPLSLFLTISLSLSFHEWKFKRERERERAFESGVKERLTRKWKEMYLLVESVFCYPGNEMRKVVSPSFFLSLFISFLSSCSSSLSFFSNSSFLRPSSHCH